MADRRIQRTETSIFNALLKLLLDKQLDDITVKELCALSNVNKSTFYKHFRDIYDCHSACSRYVTVALLNTLRPFHYEDLASRPEHYLKHIFSLIEKNSTFYYKIDQSPYYANVIFSIKSWIIRDIIESDQIDLEKDFERYIRIVYLVDSVTASIMAALPYRFDKQQLIRLLSAQIRYGCQTGLEEYDRRMADMPEA